MPLLIDGHNVIAALPDINLEDPHDEAKLVLKLRAWTGQARRKAIVIFDGGIPGGYSNTLSTSSVRVIFAARHHSNADRIIKERLARLPDAGNWTVISSDYEVLDNARQVGAQVMTAQDFADILNFEPDAWKEKPDTISAAEVEVWLQIFQQPASPSREKAPAAPPAAPPPTSETQPSETKEKKRRPQRDETPVRTTRTIGEQIGREPEKPARPVPAPTVAGKPDSVSAAEVDAWLEVFHDTPGHIPPPKPRPAPPPRKPKPLAVSKEGELSEEDVESWLALFADAPEPPPEPEAPKPAKTASAKKSKPSGARLAKRKRNLVPTKQEGDGLSAEDQELWQRMFGDEER